MVPRRPPGGAVFGLFGRPDRDGEICRSLDLVQHGWPAVDPHFFWEPIFPGVWAGVLMSVGEVCNREVVYLRPEASVAEAARLMREYHVGDLVVADDAGGQLRPVGIVTDRDIVVEVVAEGVACDEVAVKDMMTTDLLTAAEGDDLLDTVRRMRERGVRRVPVVDRAEALVGILTVDDLVDLLSEQLAHVVGLFGKAAYLERERRSE